MLFNSSKEAFLMNLKKFQKIKEKKEKSYIVSHTCCFCHKTNSFRIDPPAMDHTNILEVKLCHFCKKQLIFNVLCEETLFGLCFTAKEIHCAHCDKPIHNFNNVILYENEELEDKESGGFVHGGQCEFEVDRLVSLGIGFYKYLKKYPGYLNQDGVLIANQQLRGKAH